MGMIAPVQTGTLVVGSDGGRVGNIVTVCDLHVVVEHGTNAKHDLYIPIDALVRSADSALAVNVPAGRVDSQGWMHPPMGSACPTHPRGS